MKLHHRISLWIAMSLALLYGLGMTWLDSLGRKRAPVRDWGRIRWFKP